jgi:hypothetical protein
VYHLKSGNPKVMLWVYDDPLPKSNAILSAVNGQQSPSKRTRHMRIRFIKANVDNKEISIEHCEIWV